jgi:hypothetical protein
MLRSSEKRPANLICMMLYQYKMPQWAHKLTLLINYYDNAYC